MPNIRAAAAPAVTAALAPDPRDHALTDLREALARDELELHYQPIVSLDSGEIMGFEALVRWDHPRRGLLAPSAFLGPVEELGVIHDLKYQVDDLTERLKQSADGWRSSLGLSDQALAEAELRHGSFAIGLRGSNPGKADAVEALVLGDRPIGPVSDGVDVEAEEDEAFVVELRTENATEEEGVYERIAIIIRDDD